MKDYKKRLLKIFIPIMLSNLITQLQMLIDRIFLSRISVLYMSAVGNVSAPMWTTMSFVFSLSIGASILISQAVGEGNKEKIETYAASLFKFSSVIPLLLFFFWMFCSPVVFRMMKVDSTEIVFENKTMLELCLSYTRFYAPAFFTIGLGSAFIVILQTSNYTKPLIAYGIIRSAANIILDYVMIFGKFGCPRLGITGAAIASAIAEYLGMAYAVVIFVKNKKLSTKPSVSAILKSKFMPYFTSAKLGVNTALEDFLWNFGNIGLIRILNTINKEAAGIYNIVFGVEIIVVVIIGAIGNGTMTLCGEATGARDGVMLKSVVKTAYKWAACVAGVTVVLSIFFPDQILSIFLKNDKSMIAASRVFLILISINLFGKSANIIVGNGIRGYGDPQWMFFSQVFGTMFILTTAYLLVNTFKMGMTGVYVAVLADEFIRGIVNTVRFSLIKMKN